MNFDPKDARILIIDDDAEVRYALHRVLSSRQYQVISAGSGEEGLELAGKEELDVIFLDNRMEGMSGLETLKHLRTVNPSAMVILMTAYGTTQTAIEAMKHGAYDYIIKPFETKRVLSLTETAINDRRDLTKAEGEYRPLLSREDYQEGIVGSSEPMQEVFKVIGQTAASDVTIMITGESGTGKELVARCIRQHSLRTEKPFIAVNCAAIPEDLIESELFGHEKGAFTGATQLRTGKFELADGGTIFLDEIGDMSLSTQTKILRVLQEGEIQRVGGTETIKVDVRLIAATNKPLEAMVADKTFREDLYYRLNVVRIRLPALRERLEDIPQIVDFMLQRMAKDRGSRVKQVSSEALGVLMGYHWPGNVRELENVIQRSTVVAQGETILVKDIPQEIRQAGSKPAPAAPVEEEKKPAAEPEAAVSEMIGEVASPTGEGGDEALAAVVPMQIGFEESFDIVYENVRREQDRSILQAVEREMIQRALKETGGNQLKASDLLGMARVTLRKRIDQYSIRY